MQAWLINNINYTIELNPQSSIQAPEMGLKVSMYSYIVVFVLTNPHPKAI